MSNISYQAQYLRYVYGSDHVMHTLIWFHFLHMFDYCHTEGASPTPKHSLCSAKHVIIQLWQTHLWRPENRFQSDAFLDSFHHFIHSSGLHVLRNCGFCEKINTVFIEDGGAAFTSLDLTSTSIVSCWFCIFLFGIAHSRA